LDTAVKWGDLSLQELLGHFIAADVEERKVWHALDIL